MGTGSGNKRDEIPRAAALVTLGFAPYIMMVSPATALVHKRKISPIVPFLIS